VEFDLFESFENSSCERGDLTISGPLKIVGGPQQRLVFKRVMEKK
jgi:hypothetical protein